MADCNCNWDRESSVIRNAPPEAMKYLIEYRAKQARNCPIHATLTKKEEE